MAEASLALFSPHHEAFDAYRHALQAGDLADLIRADEVAGHEVKHWELGVGAPDVAIVLDALECQGDVTVLDFVAHPVALSVCRHLGLRVLRWCVDVGAVVASPGWVAAWWYRAELDDRRACVAPGALDEWIVLGLATQPDLWRYRVPPRADGSCRRASPRPVAQ